SLLSELLGAGKLIKHASGFISAFTKQDRPLFDPKLLAQLCQDLSDLSHTISALQNAERLAKLSVDDAWNQLRRSILRVLDGLERLNIIVFAMYDAEAAGRIGYMLVIEEVEVMGAYSAMQRMLWRIKSRPSARRLRRLVERFETIKLRFPEGTTMPAVDI